MRILQNIHLYFPRHACGGERYLHNINKYLISKGHQVRVILNQAAMHNVSCPYTYEGVEVMAPVGHIDQYMWGDIFMTHLDFTHNTIELANILKKPVVTIVHNSHPYQCVQNAVANNFIIYNSNWLKEKINYQWPGMVFTPAVDHRIYDQGQNPRENEYITMINLDENKGGKIFARVAAALPNKKFLAVKGSYSEPASIGQWLNQPPNVTIIPNNPDILPVYRQTRILLMPSRYESWGMTATEAMSNGIPVICTPTPGLRENCGEAGIYVKERGPIEVDKSNGKVISDDGDSYDISYIVKAIKKLDSDKKYYQSVSDLCRKRAKEQDPLPRLAEVESFLYHALSVSKTQQIKTGVKRINFV